MLTLALDKALLRTSSRLKLSPVEMDRRDKGFPATEDAADVVNVHRPLTAAAAAPDREINCFSMIRKEEEEENSYYVLVRSMYAARKRKEEEGSF